MLVGQTINASLVATVPLRHQLAVSTVQADQTELVTIAGSGIQVANVLYFWQLDYIAGRLVYFTS